MISTRINFQETQYHDISIDTDSGFPVLYAGRGSYSGQLQIWSYHAISAEEEVHLIYVGRYTAIGENVSIYCDMDHDFNSVYMGLISDYADQENKSIPFRERIGQADRRMNHKGMVIIGNDVWIGNDVTIISDVVIGNGAIIGAGSVVTHGIPPYTMYCGNPAVYIRDRFPGRISNALQRISWWDFSREKLLEIREDMKGEVEAFVSKFEPPSKKVTDNGDRPSIFGIDNNRYIILSFIDLDTSHPVFPNIIEQFCSNPPSREISLVICYHKDDKKIATLADSLSDFASNFSDTNTVCLCGINSSDDESVICNADCLILGREILNIQRISYAMKYGVKLISGVNKPIRFDP